jgi:hypothetical protein
MSIICYGCGRDLSNDMKEIKNVKGDNAMDIFPQKKNDLNKYIEENELDICCSIFITTFIENPYELPRGMATN